VESLADRLGNFKFLQVLVGADLPRDRLGDLRFSQVFVADLGRV
jgi:hypothetical protein